ncbi:FAD/NAD(P)-binding domain-containing protein [Annulohypoxylon bovei var. microspora]|nr:FAD/NAD(P)-binding domain-containing protein [Annulohypoxylon bovei var. microspora]
MAPRERPLSIIIVGGSLSGLMCGISLKHAGHSVTIIEKDDDKRQSHMAGVCLGIDGENWLSRHDRHTKSFFTHRSNRVQLLKEDGTLQILVNVRRDITNWDTLYYRLRSLFDGYRSAWYPSPPPTVDTDGLVTYESRKEVLSVASIEDIEEKSKVILEVRDCKTENVSVTEADLVIAADGPNSSIRAKYLPNVRRKYVGYVAWRGTVPENEVSPSTRQIFERSVTVHRMSGRHHCLVYTIPGNHGTLTPGERYLNFLWYTRESSQALEEIMKDGIDGHRHHYVAPRGRVREDVWRARVRHAEEIPFPAPFLDIITKIQQPFIQVVTEFCSPRAAFENGRVLLLGDGLSLFRPHTAFSGTQAAFHALMTEDYISGKIPLSDWEEKVLRYSRLHWSQSMFWGEFYQNYLVIALFYLVHYWIYCIIDVSKAYWKKEKVLLRTSSHVVEEYDLD